MATLSPLDINDIQCLWVDDRHDVFPLSGCVRLNGIDGYYFRLMDFVYGTDYYIGVVYEIYDLSDTQWDLEKLSYRLFSLFVRDETPVDNSPGILFKSFSCVDRDVNLHCNYYRWRRSNYELVLGDCIGVVREFF